MATRPILYASDFSPASRPAFVKAIATARATRAPLLVAHVLDVTMPVIADDITVVPPTYPELLRAARAWAERQLGRLVAEAGRSRIRASAVLLEGRAADRIVRLARSRRAALIVIGTHGRGGLARVLLGSVAARVVASATCPVLTVRGGGRRSA